MVQSFSGPNMKQAARLHLIKALHDAHTWLDLLKSGKQITDITQATGLHDGTILEGAVRLMRTRIRLLAQPESMRSIVGATQ